MNTRTITSCWIIDINKFPKFTLLKTLPSEDEGNRRESKPRGKGRECEGGRKRAFGAFFSSEVKSACVCVCIPSVWW